MIGNASAPINVNFQWDGNVLTLHVTGNVGNNRITVNVERTIPVPPTLPIINQDIYWSTFFGFSFGSELHDNYIDGTNHLYVAGGTQDSSPIYPFNNSIMMPFAGDWDDVVAKFNPDRTLIFGTWFGGSLHDEAFAITGDASGNTCIAGHTTSNADFPLCGSPFSCTAPQTVMSGTNSGFYFKLDLTGANVLMSTFLGNSGIYEGGNAIAADALGNVYVTASTRTNSGVPPIVSLVNAYNQSTPGGASADLDGYLAKFNSSNVQVWGTYLGGSGWDVITSLTVDAANNLYALGYSKSNGVVVASPCVAYSGDFPLANPGGSAYVHQNFDNTGNTRDVFVAKFDGATNALLWSTMYGGGGDESFSESHDGGIAVDDNSGAVYITSETLSNSSNGDIPIIPAINPNSDVYWQNVAGGLGDAFIAKFNSSYDLVYSTYYGGDGDDLGSDITIAHSPILGPILGQTQIYFSGAVGFFSTYTAFPTQFAAEYYNQGVSANAKAYIAMLKDDPSNSSNLPGLNWATCLTSTGAWFVSAYNNHVVTGGFCSSVIQPDVSPAPTPLAFYQGTPPHVSGYNGFITEFGILTCAICPPSARMSNIQDDADLGITISPNPSIDGVFNLTSNLSGPVQMSVFNSFGQVVFMSSTTTDQGFRIDLSNESAGIYFVQINSSGKIITRKIIRE